MSSVTPSPRPIPSERSVDLLRVRACGTDQKVGSVQVRSVLSLSQEILLAFGPQLGPRVAVRDDTGLPERVSARHSWLNLAGFRASRDDPGLPGGLSARRTWWNLVGFRASTQASGGRLGRPGHGRKALDEAQLVESGWLSGLNSDLGWPLGTTRASPERSRRGAAGGIWLAFGETTLPGRPTHIPNIETSPSLGGCDRRN